MPAHRVRQGGAQRVDVDRSAQPVGLGDRVGGRFRIELVGEPDPVLGGAEGPGGRPVGVDVRCARRHGRAGCGTGAGRRPAGPDEVGHGGGEHVGGGERPAPQVAQAEQTRVAASESPPSSTKVSCTPTGPAPSTSAQMPASRRSSSVRGSTRSPSASRCPSGAGRAARSSLPLGPTGNAGTATNADGTMCPGSRSARWARNTRTPGTAPATTYPTSWPACTAVAAARPRHGTQRRVDLTQLDPVAPDLDLVVDPAQVVHRPVGQPPGQVPGAVQPGAGRAERVGDEPLGRQPGPAEVAGRAGPRPGRVRRRPPVRRARPGCGCGCSPPRGRC